VPTVTAAPTDLRPAFVYAHDKDYVLDHNGVRRVLRELSRVAPRHDFLVCNLSEGSMTLEVLNTLPSKLESVCGSQTVALDLSYNRIVCNSWEEIEPLLDHLLGKHVVQYLDLGNNWFSSFGDFEAGETTVREVQEFRQQAELAWL